MGASLLDMMESELEGKECIFLEYIQTKKQEKDVNIYCFFEGKDDYKYYGNKIKNYTTKEIIPYDCNGKKNVLELFDMIKNKSVYSKNDTLFFIDRDFDEGVIYEEDIYVTPCYSIENFYVEDSCFEDLLKGELGLRKSSISHKINEDFLRGLSYLQTEREKFINNTLNINIWYYLQNKKNNSTLTRIKLSNIKSIRGFKQPIEFEELKNKTEGYMELTEEEIKEASEWLMENPIKRFRGKYYEEFLGIVISSMKQNSNTIFKYKRKLSIQPSKDNIVSLLAQYAYTPECLKQYLITRLLDEHLVKLHDKFKIS
ncbi:DUF4435 domain-containing protein [Romboutsia sp. 1001713B170207_170306_H8]|uniref:DUF4435 domain-containing protein n=1 Tax=Romboutsia sp. 1001713B170207_170306_H8 TaxID=2787112 RepID=UPI00189C2EB7|nr:DUF4435 domain-containing protein [Romboutsia sp. 1001713B170207_170306_H8]